MADKAAKLNSSSSPPPAAPHLRKRTNPRPRLRPPAPGSDFDGAGGFLDIYGLMFGIGNGVFVDLFDNGVSPYNRHELRRLRRSESPLP